VQDVELVGGCRRKIAFPAGDEDLDLRPPGVETTGAHEGAAAVAAGAGHHHHRLASRVAAEEPLAGEVGEISAGVLHHLGELDVKVLDHCPVDFDHLFGGEPRDRGVEIGVSIFGMLIFSLLWGTT